MPGYQFPQLEEIKAKNAEEMGIRSARLIEILNSEHIFGLIAQAQDCTLWQEWFAEYATQVSKKLLRIQNGLAIPSHPKNQDAAKALSLILISLRNSGAVLPIPVVLRILYEITAILSPIDQSVLEKYSLTIKQLEKRTTQLMRQHRLYQIGEVVITGLWSFDIGVGFAALPAAVLFFAFAIFPPLAPFFLAFALPLAAVLLIGGICALTARKSHKTESQSIFFKSYDDEYHKKAKELSHIADNMNKLIPT